jgi:dihydroorotase
VHVHLRDPGYPHKEDFASGTAAAACGGVTTVFDMPNTIPPTGTAEALAAKHRIAGEKAHVDFGLYGLLGEDTIEHVPALVSGGVIGFKLYMGNTFGRIPCPSTGAMLEAFEVVAPTGKRISLHAETNSIMERREARLRGAGRLDPLAHLASRPAVVAVEAVSRAALLAEWTGARIHILHISSAEELRPLREAKARGVDITGETCPHYLMLSSEDYARFAGTIRVNPPVRERRNQERLWEALTDGTIDLIATDHAPHAPEEKTRNDIWTVDCGFPGVETQMPLMLTQCNAGRFDIRNYVRWSAANPARIFGLYPRKGAIQPGSDADITIVDLAREWAIDDAALQSRSKITPWNGRRVQGLPIHTLVRGRFVMRDRALLPETRGWGRSVHVIQKMPTAELRNADQTMQAIVRNREHAA